MEANGANRNVLGGGSVCVRHAFERGARLFAFIVDFFALACFYVYARACSFVVWSTVNMDSRSIKKVAQR